MPSSDDNPLGPVHERLSNLLEQGGQGEAEQLVTLLYRRMRSVQERGMRPEIIEGFVESLDDAGLLAMVQRLLDGAAEGCFPHRVVHRELALEYDLFRTMPYARIRDLYRIARDASLHEVARLFLGERLRTNPTVEEALRENEHLQLSAGERKAAARRNDRFLLDRLLHDRDPRVIATFLDNPRAVEADIVRIAAMRPTNADILRLVARHPRWSCRYEVRKTLVCNPYTPRTLALQLLSTLLAQDLRFVLSTETVPSEVRHTARRHLLRLATSRAGISVPVGGDGPTEEDAPEEE